MHDQPFAGEYLKSGRWIEIATGFLTVGRRATDHLVVKKKKALDRCRYGVERCVTLPCGEPNFEDTVLARQRDGLPEPGPRCQISSSIRSLRGGSRIRPCKRQQDPDGAKSGKGQKAAAQTTRVDPSHVRPQSIRDGTLVVATTSNGGGQGRAAAIQQETVGILQAREDNNPAHGSRNLYDHNTTGFLIPMILT